MNPKVLLIFINFEGFSMEIIKPFKKEDDIYIYLEDLNKFQIAEDNCFRNSDIESVSADLYLSFFMKVQSIKFLNDIIQRYKLDFKNNFLELGGGYGFLSAYIKKKYPNLTVYYSDVSKEAVRKSKQYESFFNSRIDQKWITSAEDTPFPDKCIDRILFFASFHHLQDQEKAVMECSRILKPDGKLYLLFEPCCPIFFKPIYNMYTKREKIKENNFTLSEYRRFFKNAGLDFIHYNYKNFIYRHSKISILYYIMLNCIPNFLTSFFPCTQVIIGEKSAV